MEEIKMLKLKELKEFKNHPFKVIRNAELDELMRIIIDSGIDKDHPLLKEYDIRQIKYKKSTNNSFIKREWLNRFNIKNYRHAYNLIFEYIELHNQMIYIRNFFIKSSISKDSKKVLGVIELIKNIEEQEQKFLLSILQKLR